MEKVREFFVKDIKSKYISFKKEFIHLKNIINFFDSKNHRDNSELRTEIMKLIPIRDIIWEKSIASYNSKFFEKLKKQTNPIEFYKDYIKLNYWIKWGIDMLSFLEKKIKYIMECFPKYYPIPNLSRTRQETGIYKAIEKDLYFYLKYFKEIFKLDSMDVDYVYIFWEYSETNEFVKNVLGLYKDKNSLNSFFLFKGAYYIITTPSLWPLLAHEVLHYYLRQFRYINRYITHKNNTDINNIFNIFEEISIIFKETIYKIVKEPNDKFMQQLDSLIEDCFIDTICLKILGLPYYFSCLRTLLGYDEFVEFLTPIEIEDKFKTNKIISTKLAFWPIRLLSLSYLVKGNYIHDNQLKYYNKSINDYFKFIEMIHESRVYLTPFGDLLYKFINIEKNISKNLKICLDFIYKKVGKILDNSAWDKREEKINFYNTLYDRFIKIKNEEQLHEGRILALTFNYNTFYNKNDEIIPILVSNKEDKYLPMLQTKYITKKTLVQEVFPSLRVLLIKFYKIRYDYYITEQSIIEFLENENNKRPSNQSKLMLHLGPYSYVDFDFDYTTKKDSIKDDSIKDDSIKDDSIKDDSIKLPYYKEEYASTLIYHISTNNELISFMALHKKYVDDIYKGIIETIKESPFIVVIQIKLADKETLKDKSITSIINSINSTVKKFNYIMQQSNSAIFTHDIDKLCDALKKESEQLNINRYCDIKTNIVKNINYMITYFNTRLKNHNDMINKIKLLHYKLIKASKLVNNHESSNYRAMITDITYINNHINAIKQDFISIIKRYKSQIEKYTILINKDDLSIYNEIFKDIKYIITDIINMIKHYSSIIERFKLLLNKPYASYMSRDNRDIYKYIDDIYQHLNKEFKQLIDKDKLDIDNTIIDNINITIDSIKSLIKQLNNVINIFNSLCSTYNQSVNNVKLLSYKKIIKLCESLTLTKSPNSKNIEKELFNSIRSIDKDKLDIDNTIIDNINITIDSIKSLIKQLNNVINIFNSLCSTYNQSVNNVKLLSYKKIIKLCESLNKEYNQLLQQNKLDIYKKIIKLCESLNKEYNQLLQQNKLDIDRKIIVSINHTVKKYKAEVLLTLGFGWADYSLIFFLNTKKNNLTSYNLNDFVKHIKDKIHQSDFIHRSKTEILINVDSIKKNEKLPPLSLLLRKKSLGKDKKKLENLIKKLKSILGTDNVSIFYNPGIYDLEIDIINSIEYSKLKKVLKEIGTSKISFSDIQIHPKIPLSISSLT